MSGVRFGPPWCFSFGSRVFVTVWVVYCLHFATNIVREHYPAFALAERGTLRVDPYLGLHPDLFELPGRGTFINSNPGASIVGALPYALVRSGIDAVVANVQAQRAEHAAPLSAEYDAPDHPNSRKFFAQVRERGLDVRFGLAAFAIQVLGVAPLGAAAALVMLVLLRRRRVSDPVAAALTLLFAFGTPIFFRGGFLNQNLLVAQLTLFAFALIDRPGDAETRPARLTAAGACLGYGVLCDYSGLVPLLAISGFAGIALAQRGGAREALRAGWMALGAAGPLLGLALYQYWAFGHPLFPPQHYMPREQYTFAGVGYSGFTWPAADLLLQNLIDPRFGLFAFGPLLLLAFAAPLLAARGRSFVAARDIALAFGLFLALLLFSSANQYGRLQWNTGVRYMVPAVPLLFLASAAVLARLPRQLALALALLAVAHGTCLAMVREDVSESLVTVLLSGPRLPWLTVLGKMGGQYVELLGKSPPSPLALLALIGALLALLWWPFEAARAPERRGHR